MATISQLQTFTGSPISDRDEPLGWGWHCQGMLRMENLVDSACAGDATSPPRLSLESWRLSLEALPGDRYGGGGLPAPLSPFVPVLSHRSL